MREKLNSNPIAQVALVGVLLVLAAVFFMSSSGGGSESGEESSSGEATATTTSAEEALATAGTGTAGTAGSTSAATAPPTTAPPPKPVVDAYEAGDTVVLLFVHDKGIDDRLVRDATARLSGMPGVATFVVPAARISRYAAISEGVGVNRVPALVVIRPRRVQGAVPTASVSYGFQSGESVVQVVIDAGYKGPTVPYHP
jgi:hypothetical protein